MAADEEPGARFCFVADHETGLQHGPGRILRLVRPGAAAGPHQSHGERPARNPGGTGAGVVKHHRQNVRDPQAGGGGDRQRAAGARAGRWHPACEERQVHRRARGELAVAQAGAGAPERAGHHDNEGPARPRHHRRAPRLRLSPLLLSNEEDFRRAVFDRYLVEYEKLLPCGPVAWKELLCLIAALSPLSVADGWPPVIFLMKAVHRRAYPPWGTTPTGHTRFLSYRINIREPGLGGLPVHQPARQLGVVQLITIFRQILHQIVPEHLAASILGKRNDSWVSGNIGPEVRHTHRLSSH